MRCLLLFHLMSLCILLPPVEGFSVDHEEATTDKSTSTTPTTTDDHDHDHDHDDDDGYSKLSTWMKSHGGRVDPRMTIGKDSDGIRGILASSDIRAHVELLFCPWELVIGSTSMEDQMTTEEDMCEVVKFMATEIRLGDHDHYRDGTNTNTNRNIPSSSTNFWPYLNHIQLPRLGSMWGPTAVQALQGLSPSSELHRHEDWFSQNCNGGSIPSFDHATIQALVSFISRASAVGMIPIYDLLNHHNGLKNTKLFVTNEGVELRTIQPVFQGQQLYLSYGLKTSSQMYRDYGFVEAWPRLWSWKDVETQDNHVFALFPEGVAAVHPSAEFLKQIWMIGSSSSTTTTTSSQSTTATIATSSLLKEWQTNATKHSQEEVTEEAMMRFRIAGASLLDGLPTRWEEDEVILIQKEEERQQFITEMATTSKTGTIATAVTITHNKNNDENHVLELGDVIAAIRYRMDFKRGVADAMLMKKQQNTETSTSCVTP